MKIPYLFFLGLLILPVDISAQDKLTPLVIDLDDSLPFRFSEISLTEYKDGTFVRNIPCTYILGILRYDSSTILHSFDKIRNENFRYEISLTTYPNTLQIKVNILLPHFYPTGDINEAFPYILYIITFKSHSNQKMHCLDKDNPYTYRCDYGWGATAHNSCID